MSKRKLILIRHGEINSNLKQIYSGRSNEPLNARGIKQSKLLSKKLSIFKIGTILTSPLKRALKTACEIKKTQDCALIVSEYFNELKMGPWEGKSEKEIKENFHEEWRLWNNFPSKLHLKERETLGMLKERVNKGLSKFINKTESSECLCIVSHVAILRLIILQIEKKSLNLYRKINVLNAKPYVFNLDDLKL